jgi:hypothetical protein
MTIDGRYIQIQFRDIRRRFPLIHAPEDVAAIRRHPRTLSRDLAALRASVPRAVEKLQAIQPHVLSQHRAAPLLGQRMLPPAAKYALHALRYSLRTRGLGTLALREWVSQRRVRGSGARP